MLAHLLLVVGWWNPAFGWLVLLTVWWLVGHWEHWLVGWLVGWLVRCLVGWLVVWSLMGALVGWLVGGWLVGWLVGHFPNTSISFQTQLLNNTGPRSLPDLARTRHTLSGRDWNTSLTKTKKSLGA